MRLFYTLIFFFFGFVSLSGNSFSSDTGIVNIEILPSKTQIIAGDSLSVFCRLTYPKGFTVGEPYLKTPSDSYEIENKKQVSSSSVNNNVTTETEFVIYNFAPDTLVVGPFTVDYIRVPGDSGSVDSKKIVILVKSVLKTPDSPPLPDRAPLEIKSTGPALWKIFLILIIILAAAALAYYFFKHRIKEKPLKKENYFIDEISEFERIKQFGLLESGKIKELYFLVSNAMRGFIQRNMETEALYETTDEIMLNLSKKYKNQETLQKIKEIFEESDMVKFAKYNPSSEQSSTLIDRAILPVRIILDEIKRKKEEEAAAAALAQANKNVQTETAKQGGK
jgi:hypothetical protein